MKTMLALAALAFFAFMQSGCSSGAGVSVGHDGHSHGVAAKGSTEGGVSAGVKAY